MKIECTSVDFPKWPVLDQSLWSTALLRGDFLDADGMAATWAPASKIQVQKGYGKWIHFLTLCGALPAEAALAPDLRVSELRLRAYLTLLESQNLASFSIASRISDLREALRVMVPNADLGLLGKLCKTLQSRATPTHAKHTRIRAPFEVLSACLRHMRATIGSKPNHPLQEAGKFRDGLALAFLALRPIRLKNLASIEIGRHMIWSDQRWTCHFPANETKERRDLRFYLPEDEAFTWALSLYLTKYRPLLLQDASQSLRPSGPLWVSLRKARQSAQSIYWNTCRLSEAILGVRINPHLNRDCAASALSSDAPDYILAAARILGHSSLTTTIGHYEQSSMLAAGSRLTEFILDLQGLGQDGDGNDDDDTSAANSANIFWDITA
jgi:integrase/recombinase XerD